MKAGDKGNDTAGSAAGERQESRGRTVVGIGASAGGIEAFKALVANLPTDSGISWVLIQHMAPDRESYLVSLLEGLTKMPVVQVVADMPVEPDHIYVIAPGHIMTLADGVLHPVENDSPHARRSSIDAFFISLASSWARTAAAPCSRVPAPMARSASRRSRRPAALL